MGKTCIFIFRWSNTITLCGGKAMKKWQVLSCRNFWEINIISFSSLIRCKEAERDRLFWNVILWIEAHSSFFLLTVAVAAKCVWCNSRIGMLPKTSSPGLLRDPVPIQFRKEVSVTLWHSEQMKLSLEIPLPSFAAESITKECCPNSSLEIYTATIQPPSSSLFPVVKQWRNMELSTVTYAIYSTNIAQPYDVVWQSLNIHKFINNLSSQLCSRYIAEPESASHESNMHRSNEDDSERLRDG